jgi:hypothetical protein
MTRANPLVTEALAILAKRGLVPQIGKRGKHVKIFWIDQGRRFLLVVSKTPSDWRTSLNSRATLRRILRANGMQGGAP